MKTYSRTPSYFLLLTLCCCLMIQISFSDEIPECKEYAEYEEDVCIACEDGWGVNEEGQCSECNPPCILCSENVYACTACKDGYFVEDENCVKCGKACKTCENGEECVICKENNCLECSIKECTTCDKDFILVGGKCISCGKNCKTCTQPNFCDVCEPGYFHLVNVGTCQKCDQRCEHCGVNGCEKCPKKSFANKDTGFCENCGPDCLECDSKIRCNVCDQGFFSNRTGECQMQDQNCIKVNISGCEECREGFYVDEITGLCGKCGSGCLKCPSPLECDECDSFVKKKGDNGECTTNAAIIIVFVVLGFAVLTGVWKLYNSCTTPKSIKKRHLPLIPAVN